jgi:hypothetical protein
VEAILRLVDQNVSGRKGNQYLQVSFESRIRKSHQGTLLRECCEIERLMPVLTVQSVLAGSVPLVLSQNKGNFFAECDIIRILKQIAKAITLILCAMQREIGLSLCRYLDYIS